MSIDRDQNSTPSPIERGFFRQTRDGATVFFPWGLNYRGYLLPGEKAKQRANRAASLLVMLPIAVGSWAGHALNRFLDSEAPESSQVLEALAAPGLVFLLGIGLYVVWAWRFVESLTESDLKILREERLREAAAAVKPWKLALIGCVLIGLSVLVAWLKPAVWWIGLLVFVTGGGLVYWSLCLKRAAAQFR